VRVGGGNTKFVLGPPIRKTDEFDPGVCVIVALAAGGARLRADLSNNLTVQGAVFDGGEEPPPGRFSDGPTGQPSDALVKTSVCFGS
jgi:hypothetical protein